jgi:hypothetical protein
MAQPIMPGKDLTDRVQEVREAYHTIARLAGNEKEIDITQALALIMESDKVIKSNYNVAIWPAEYFSSQPGLRKSDS